MSALVDMTGQRYGHLVVRARAPNSKGKTRWFCTCDCGKQDHIVGGHALRIGEMRSCGCARSEFAHTKHGLARDGGRSKEWYAWWFMIQRCTNKNNISYPHYGGRGIVVCERWKDPVAFVSDMGPKPSPKHSLDRIDNDGNYEPSNCRWATRTQQARNQSNTVKVMIDGASLSIPDLADIYMLPRKVVWKRYRAGVRGKDLVSHAL